MLNQTATETVTLLHRVQALEMLLKGFLQLQPNSDASAFLADWALRCREEVIADPSLAVDGWTSREGFSQAARIAQSAYRTIEEIATEEADADVIEAYRGMGQGH